MAVRSNVLRRLGWSVGPGRRGRNQCGDREDDQGQTETHFRSRTVVKGRHVNYGRERCGEVFFSHTSRLVEGRREGNE